MKIDELVLKNRSYRRFAENHAIERETLEGLVNLARHSASAGNKQPLKYYISCTPEENARIFPTLKWAGYLQDWPGPQEGERPSAYIVILGDKSISKIFHCDHGIAAQSILLGAVSHGLGGCIIGNIDKSGLLGALHLDSHTYDPLLVLAMGKPKEKVVLDEIKDGDIKYFRDEKGVHHVPKRSLSEIIISKGRKKTGK